MHERVLLRLSAHYHHAQKMYDYHFGTHQMDSCCDKQSSLYIWLTKEAPGVEHRCTVHAEYENTNNASIVVIYLQYSIRICH